MTDNEIIKALTEWSERAFTFCNVGMPEFARHILGLINRQQAEIEMLKAEAIIDESEIMCTRRHRDNAKAEAIKEFAERLKENKIDIDVSFGYGREVYTEAVAVIEIENLVKEMVGDE